MYDNPTKAAWRVWAWNEVSRRLNIGATAIKPTVCVLAGDISGDLRLIESRRVRVRCVGIDYSKVCVDQFRGNGGVCIQDTLRNQISALQPDGVIGDMVSGLTLENVAAMFDALCVCNVLVFNFLRGRDRGVRYHDGNVPVWRRNGFTIETVGSHRGKLAALFVGKLAAEQWLGMSRDSMAVPEEFFGLTKPSIYSYKSEDSGQWFDSVAMTCSDFRVTDDSLVAIRNISPVSSRRKAAAAKAVMTKRRKK